MRSWWLISRWSTMSLPSGLFLSCHRCCHWAAESSSTLLSHWVAESSSRWVHLAGSPWRKLCSLPVTQGILLSGALLLTLCCPVKWALLDYGPFSPLSDFRISRAIRLIWDSSVLVFQRFMHIWRVCTSTINWELHLFQSGWFPQDSTPGNLSVKAQKLFKEALLKVN